MAQLHLERTVRKTSSSLRQLPSLKISQLHQHLHLHLFLYNKLKCRHKDHNKSPCHVGKFLKRTQTRCMICVKSLNNSITSNRAVDSSSKVRLLHSRPSSPLRKRRKVMTGKTSCLCSCVKALWWMQKSDGHMTRTTIHRQYTCRRTSGTPSPAPCSSTGRLRRKTLTR